MLSLYLSFEKIKRKFFNYIEPIKNVLKETLEFDKLDFVIYQELKLYIKDEYSSSRPYTIINKLNRLKLREILDFIYNEKQLNENIDLQLKIIVVSFKNDLKKIINNYIRNLEKQLKENIKVSNMVQNDIVSFLEKDSNIPNEALSNIHIIFQKEGEDFLKQQKNFLEEFRNKSFKEQLYIIFTNVDKKEKSG